MTRPRQIGWGGGTAPVAQEIGVARASAYPPARGVFVALVAREAVGPTLSILQRHDQAAAVIGCVKAFTSHGEVQIKTIGGNRSLDMLTGEQLPRIC